MGKPGTSEPSVQSWERDFSGIVKICFFLHLLTVGMHASTRLQVYSCGMCTTTCMWRPEGTVQDSFLSLWYYVGSGDSVQVVRT